MNAICPICSNMFSSLSELYQHWKDTQHVEVKRTDEEVKKAISLVEGQSEAS